jgi:ferredoxin-NADP reductase
MRGHIDHIVAHTPLLWTYYLAPEIPFRFTPGEYTELYLPHPNADNRGEHRKFSIASSPTEKLIAILVTFAHANGSSFKAALRAAKPGDTVRLSETMGDFVLPKLQSIPLVFIAAGSGISPVLSMMTWVRDKQEKRPVQIIHAVSDERTLVGKDLFVSQAAQYTPIVTRPSTTWEGESGRLSAERIIQIIGKPQGKRLYLAGPEAVVTTFKKDLIGLGIERDDILTDAFLGAPETY